MTATITQTQVAQPMGQYTPTSVDEIKTVVDFRLVQVSPYYIIWNNGEGQAVTALQLKKLQNKHSWATDF